MSASRLSQVRHIIGLLVALIILLSGLAPNARIALAVGNAAPVATISGTASVFIGEPVALTVSFDNASNDSTDVGYGPYIDLFLPAAGADGAGIELDDGITFDSANYLGTPLAPITSPFICATGVFSHPLLLQFASCPIDSQVVVLQLPFGSFTPGQPNADISINATLSDLADLGTPLTVQARGGFIYGNDPLDNPSTDPPVIGPTANFAVTPTLIELRKTYIGPEDETATGPNFRRRYRIAVDVADGQTITNLDVIDTLPPTMAFLQVISTTPAGATVIDTPVVDAAANAPDNDLVVRFASITGGAGASDAVVEFEFYIPHLDASGANLLNAATGDDRIDENNASAVGDWTPIDVRDLGGTRNAVADPAGPEHRLEEQSIAIQKSLALQTDLGATGFTPQDTVQYTLDFQISDFFAFDQIVITDVISDGQRFDATFAPTLQINGHSFTLAAAAIDNANYTVFLNADNNPATPATDGSTTLTFRVSDELITRGRSDGRLVGGCVPPAGTSVPPTYCTANSPPATVNDGGTTGRIVYRTRVQEFFSDTYPSGDPSVDQGDLLSNAAEIEGRVLSNADATTPTGFTERDDTGASFTIVRGNLEKSVYAVGGIVCSPQPCSNVRLAPGETVTYRLELTLPSSDIEDLELTDYLPLPVFDATEISTVFSNTVSIDPPPAGVVKYGPTDTFSTIFPGGVPVIAVTGPGANNTVQFTYGDYDDPSNRTSKIDILFTVTASNEKFADGLFLTNQVRQTETSTNQGASFADAIIQIRLTQPVLNIRKSPVASATGFFSGPVLPAGVAISPPNTASCPRLTGTVQSAQFVNTTPLSGTFDADLNAVDAYDRITYAIVVENTGSSPNGAFDVRIRDALPSYLEIPSSGAGLNLCVTDGAGAPISFTTLGTGLFDPAGGIELNDPGPTNPPTGALDPGKDDDGNTLTNGRNIAIITYDLVVRDTAEPLQPIVNTATLFNYAGAEGAEDHTTNNLTNTGTVTIDSTYARKTRVATSEAHTAAGNAAIGEIIRYRLALQIPEGTATNFQLRDALPAGLTFLNDGSARYAYVSSGAGITSSAVGAIPALNCANIAGSFTITDTVSTASIPSSSINCTFANNNISSSETAENDTYSSGTDVSFKFGTLLNQDNDSDAEFVVVELNVLVDNTAAGSNDANDTRTNTVQPRRLLPGDSALSNAGLSADGPVERIVEPNIPFAAGSNNKTVSPTTADADDVVSYQILFTAASGATRSNAYEVRLVDPVPASVILSPGSVSATSAGGCATGIDLSATTALTVELNIGIVPPGCGITLTYTGTLRTSVSPAQQIVNTASLTYTSLPGTGTANGSGGNTTGSTTPGASGAGDGERDGSGGSINDHRGAESATVTVFSPAPTKTVTATSESHTSGTTVAIGEIVRYRIVARLAESTSTNFQLRDTLPAGLQFLDDGTTRVAFVSNGAGITSSTLSGAGLFVSGNETTIASIVPTLALTSTAISGGPFATGTDPIFSLGNVTNSDTDSDQEFVVLEFNALVLNVAGNQSGTTLANTVSVFVNGSSAATSSAVNVTVAEPVITNVDKTVTTAPADAGDTTEYRVTFSNTGNTAAFNLLLDDLMPAGLTIDTTFTPTLTLGGGTSGASATTSGNRLTLAVDQMPAAGSVTVNYRATVDSLIAAGQSITNTATLTYTSLPGSGTANGSGGNATGSTTPGASGAGTGERTGAGGVNDYADSDPATVTMAAPAVDKRQPSPATYAIGATTVFPIIVTLPEGTTRDLVVVDQLPAGLSYVSSSVITTAAASSGLLGADYAGTAPAPTVTTAGGSGDDITFTFGDTVSTANNTAGDGSFLILLTARVLNDLPGNQNGAVLSNSALLRYTDPESGALIVTDPAVTIAIAEPQITTTLSVTPASGVQAGDTLTYTLRLDSTGGVTAFDTTAVITPATGTTFASLVSCLDANGARSDVTFTPGATLLVDTSPAGGIDLPAGGFLECVYTMTALDTLVIDATHPSTADADWTSLDGTGNTDERTYADQPGVAVDGTQDADGASFTTPAPALAKSDGATNVVIGQTVPYTLSVSSPLGTLRSLVISDTLPIGMRYETTPGYSISGTSATPTFSISGPNDGSAPTTIRWTFGDTVVATSPVRITYSSTVLNVAGNQQGVGRTNTANFSYLRGDGSTGSGSDDESVTIQEPLLTIDKDAQALSANVGDPVVYRIEVRNTSSVIAYDTVVSDTLTARLNYQSGSITIVSGPSGTVDESAAPLLVWRIPAIAPGETAVLGYTATISGVGNPNTPIGNTAGVAWTSRPGSDANERTGTGGINDYTASDGASVLTAAYQIAKTLATPASGTARLGDTVTFNVVIRNTGAVSISTVPLQDVFDPAHLSFLSASVTPDTTTPAGTLGWNDAATSDIAAGSSITLTVNFTALAPGVTTTNTVTATGVTDVNSIVLPTLADDANVTIGRPDLTIAKDDGGVTAVVGGVITYTLAYENIGNQEARGTVISETVPLNTSFVAAASTPGWSCADGAPAGTGCTLAVGTVAAGAPASVFFAVRVDDPLPAGVNVISNTVEIADDGSGGSDPTPLNNFDNEQTPVSAAPDLVVIKSDGGAAVAPGDILSYTLTYSNTGTQNATGVTLRETAPANTTFSAAASTPGWSCANGAAAGTACNFPIGALNVGVSGVVTFSVTILPLPAGAGSVPNTVVIDDDGLNGADIDGGNNTSSVVTSIDALPDLRITISQPTIGQPIAGVIIYTLHYTNTGNRGASNVVIADVVPQFTTFFAAASAPGWSCPDGAPAGALCTVNVGSLAPGQSGMIVIAVRAGPAVVPGVTQIVNSVLIGDDGTNGLDPTPQNNTDSVVALLDPTAIVLVRFDALYAAGRMIITWETAAELGTRGFHLYRSANGRRDTAIRVTEQLIIARGNVQLGSVYEWEDAGAEAGVSYTYWLEEIEQDGTRLEYGPFVVRIVPDALPVRLYTPRLTR